MNPGPAGFDVELELVLKGFKNPNPVDGTEGGFGILTAGALVGSLFLVSCPGAQPDFCANSSRCLETWSDSDASVSDRSQNGSSLTAFEIAWTSDELSPRIDVQYWISASLAPDFP
jgi:hypothetical protein